MNINWDNNNNNEFRYFFSVVIRKWDVTKNGKFRNYSENSLHKQILTLHKKLKKTDRVASTYSIERDDIKIQKHHVHVLFHVNDIDNLYNRLQTFIKGGDYCKEYINGHLFHITDGKYGTIHIERIYDNSRYFDRLHYVNKYGFSKTLV